MLDRLSIAKSVDGIFLISQTSCNKVMLMVYESKIFSIHIKGSWRFEKLSVGVPQIILSINIFIHQIIYLGKCRVLWGRLSGCVPI